MKLYFTYDGHSETGLMERKLKNISCLFLCEWNYDIVIVRYLSIIIKYGSFVLIIAAVNDHSVLSRSRYWGQKRRIMYVWLLVKVVSACTMYICMCICYVWMHLYWLGETYSHVRCITISCFFMSWIIYVRIHMYVNIYIHIIIVFINTIGNEYIFI